VVNRLNQQILERLKDTPLVADPGTAAGTAAQRAAE
jgi:hypothetical protein